MQAATLAGRFIHFSGYLTENSTGRPITNRPITINLQSATGSPRWLYARTDHLGHWSAYAQFSERMNWIVRFLDDEHYTASHSAVRNPPSDAYTVNRLFADSGSP